MTTEPINIAPEGDLILIVSSADDALKFRVCSHVLRSASEYFRKLLSPNFAEGQALSAEKTNPTEITLFGDEPESMKFILQIIHFKNNDLPQKLDAAQILSIAIVIDKYFLHDMKYALYKWLAPTEDSNLRDYLQAALILDDADLFEKVVDLMVWNQSTSYEREDWGRGEEFIRMVGMSGHLFLYV